MDTLMDGLLSLILWLLARSLSRIYFRGGASFVSSGEFLRFGQVAYDTPRLHYHCPVGRVIYWTDEVVASLHTRGCMGPCYVTFPFVPLLPAPAEKSYRYLFYISFWLNDGQVIGGMETNMYRGRQVDRYRVIYIRGACGRPIHLPV